MSALSNLWRGHRASYVLGRPMPTLRPMSALPAQLGAKHLIHRGYGTRAYQNLLEKSIQYYNQGDKVESYKNLLAIIENKNLSKGVRAVAHLYMGKNELGMSTLFEWRAIKNLEESKRLFTEIALEQNKSDKAFLGKYFAKVEEEFNKINAAHGSVEEYKKWLVQHLNPAHR